jgi:hypothetical protein
VSRRVASSAQKAAKWGGRVGRAGGAFQACEPDGGPEPGGDTGGVHDESVRIAEPHAVGVELVLVEQLHAPIRAAAVEVEIEVDQRDLGGVRPVRRPPYFVRTTRTDDTHLTLFRGWGPVWMGRTVGWGVRSRDEPV